MRRPFVFVRMQSSPKLNSSVIAIGIGFNLIYPSSQNASGASCRNAHRTAALLAEVECQYIVPKVLYSSWTDLAHAFGPRINSDQRDNTVVFNPRLSAFICGLDSFTLPAEAGSGTLKRAPQDPLLASPMMIHLEFPTR